MYQIIIKDLDTGEVQNDIQTDCIIGAYNLPDKCSAEEVSCVVHFAVTGCLAGTILATLKGVDEAKEFVKRKMVVNFIKRMSDEAIPAEGPFPLN